jgi:hypothetical protein
MKEYEKRHRRNRRNVKGADKVKKKSLTLDPLNPSTLFDRLIGEESNLIINKDI